MRYPPHILEEIRARLPVSSVVGRKVRLKKAGREWRGLSPFNAEKSPSFYANDQKGFYHCFSSGKHGDVFAFLMETEGLTFPEAVERLAAEAGVDLPKPSPAAARDEERRRDLVDVVELAARFFEAELARRDGLAARTYLDGRGVGPELRATFRIGYAPASRTALRDHLSAKGVPIADTVAAGLLVVPEDGREPFDRFRDRVMFPIANARAHAIGFGGRALRDDVTPKYLNSPEGPLFDKGRLVYNLHRAGEPRYREQETLVVEGYLDAIALTGAGLGNVVATLGTALTPEQIALLWRLAPEPIICFDGDRAGQAAAFRTLERILPALRTGFSFRFAFLPAGRDPDDVVREGGQPAMARILAGARSVWDVIWMRELAAARLETENGQAVFERDVTALVDLIADPALRARYRARARAEIREHLWQLTRARAGRDKHSGQFNGMRSVIRSGAAPDLAAPAESKREALILLLRRAHPELLEHGDEDLAQLDFNGPAAREVASAVLTGRPVSAEAVARLAARLPLPFERALLAPAADPAQVQEAFGQALVLQRRDGLAQAIAEVAAEFAADETEAAGEALRDLKVRQGFELRALPGDR
jgi:DNA primase